MNFARQLGRFLAYQIGLPLVIVCTLPITVPLLIIGNAYLWLKDAWEECK